MITRDDLSPGMQIAQTAHAVAEFAIKYPAEAKQWFETSNYIVCLACSNEEALLDYADRLHHVSYVLVFEPDIDGHTAITVAPGEHWRELSSLPLAGREAAMST